MGQQVTMVRPEPAEPTLAQLTKAYANSIAIWRARIDYQDLLEELGDAEAQVTAAIATGDAALIGGVVLAIRDAYVERLIKHHEGWDIKTQFANEAASAVLAGVKQ